MCMINSSRGDCITHQSGFSLVELLIATSLAGLLIVGLNGVIGQALTIQDAVSEKNDLTRQVRFAMEQMVRAVSHSRLLLLPLNDNPSTTLVENIREQTEPPSAPPAGSTLGTAVLAVTLPAYQDLDGDGFSDADDDRDGRIDEDLSDDKSYDFAPGIYRIDDDGNGTSDSWLSPNADDDESNDLAKNEDAINGIDDDGDGNIDEDPGADNNGDGCPGICGVDDDGDSVIDEGSPRDDDEDGRIDEDWYNPVVFYLDNGILKERTPVGWDVSGGGLVGGQDFITSDIAENVTHFRVERIPQLGGRSQIINITLELADADSGASVSLNTRIRVGGAL